MFALDSTLYRFLGTSAYLYMVVAVGCLSTEQAPIAPESIMTYYSVLLHLRFYTVFSGANMVDILRSQQTSFSDNVAHVMGVIDALN